MTAIVAGRAERNSVLLGRNVDHGNQRSCTDKYWNLLFVFSFGMWIIAWRNGAFRYESDCLIDLDSSGVTANTTEFSKSQKDCKITYDDNTAFINKIEYVSQVWGKNWLFDAITCNVGFLEAHYEKSGSIVAWVNVLISIGLIAYFAASMRTDVMFRSLLEFFPTYLFVAFTAAYRYYYYEKHHRPRSDAASTPFDVTVMFWVAPELILITVKSTISLPRPVDLDYSKDDNRIVRFNQFEAYALGYYMFVNVAIMLALLLPIAILSGNCELNWENGWSYVYVGILYCFWSVIVHYFGLMVISCATSLSYEKRSACPRDFFRALFIVARYHFGTVCYHATVILPRISAMFVMNEKEFKEIPKLSAIDRFYLTHWKVHRLTSTMTGALGHNHSKSIRESLRLFTSDSPILKKLQSHTQLNTSCTALVMATNSLLIIVLWAHGIAIDSRFSVEVWIMYLIVVFLTYFIGRSFDAAADTLWLHYDGRVVMKF